jgi:hypothetical protein
MTDFLTRSRLAKSCERGFEALIERLFDHPHIIPGRKLLAEVPVVGGVYIVGEEHYMRCFVPKIAAALIARERFKQDAPAWAGELPVHLDNCVRQRYSHCPREALVGYYAYSLLEADYDCDIHPSFDAYGRGVMAYWDGPEEIRCDPELQDEFPPQELEGLCDGLMIWRTQERIAFDRDMIARHAALQTEAERAAEGW